MPYIICPDCESGYDNGRGSCPHCTAHAEAVRRWTPDPIESDPAANRAEDERIEALILDAAEALGSAYRAVRDARLTVLALDDVPPAVPLRTPGEPARIAIGPADVPLSADDVRPGMRLIGGEWFYSSAWL